MESLDFENIKIRSIAIREKYRKLELEHHGNEWNIEEDALAFLTDAGLIGRLVMSQQGRWPKVGISVKMAVRSAFKLSPHFVLR